jgi:hypothetical protein
MGLVLGFYGLKWEYKNTNHWISADQSEKKKIIMIIQTRSE